MPIFFLSHFELVVTHEVKVRHNVGRELKAVKVVEDSVLRVAGQGGVVEEVGGGAVSLRPLLRHVVVEAVVRCALPRVQVTRLGKDLGHIVVGELGAVGRLAVGGATKFRGLVTWNRSL